MNLKMSNVNTKVSVCIAALRSASQPRTRVRERSTGEVRPQPSRERSLGLSHCRHDLRVSPRLVLVRVHVLVSA